MNLMMNDTPVQVGAAYTIETDKGLYQVNCSEINKWNTVAWLDSDDGTRLQLNLVTGKILVLSKGVKHASRK